MASKKQSFGQSYKLIALKSFIGVAVIGLFSYFGAAYLQASHAVTAPQSFLPPSLTVRLPGKAVKTANYWSMKPYASVGLVMPYTVQELLDTDGLVATGQTVYQLPASKRLSNSVSGTTSVETGNTFHVYPSKITGYKICALVRRDRTAPAERMSVMMVARNVSTEYSLPGTNGYYYACTNTLFFEANLNPGYVINGRVTNNAAPHAMRVASIILVQTSY
ncbi:MAG TPA: hypothetical protein VLF39_00605 [Candidatus Saccharimonadales bacterium]|nr:hypothetical protein [Candidatus Saccharimonadales bacterium]